jgi:hypothetical protein
MQITQHLFKQLVFLLIHVIRLDLLTGDTENKRLDVYTDL